MARPTCLLLLGTSSEPAAHTLRLHTSTQLAPLCPTVTEGAETCPRRMKQVTAWLTAALSHQFSLSPSIHSHLPSQTQISFQSPCFLGKLHLAPTARNMYRGNRQIDIDEYPRNVHGVTGVTGSFVISRFSIALKKGAITVAFRVLGTWSVRITIAETVSCVSWRFLNLAFATSFKL